MPTVQAFALQSRVAGQYDSALVNVNKLDGQTVVVQGSLNAPQRDDPNFKITTLVMGTTDPSGPAPENSLVELQKEEFWGGNVGHNGVPLQPGFSYSSAAVPPGIVRLMLRIITNADATWGFSVTVP